MRFQRSLVRRAGDRGRGTAGPCSPPLRRAAADRIARSADTSPRRCAARSRVRRTAPSPAPPPCWPRRRVPCPPAAAARTVVSRPMPRHSASARYTSPNRRGRSMRISLQPDRHRQMAGAVLEQRRLLRCADQSARQRARFEAAAFVEFAEMRNRLLDHSPPHPDAAHQRPVAMDLAVLLASRVAQVHAPSKSRPPAKEMAMVATTRPIRPASRLTN